MIYTMGHEDSGDRMKRRAIIDLVGTSTIVVGLVFVGLELKHNTEAVESQTSQGLLELANDANNQIASDEQLAELILKANKGVDVFNEREALQYSRFVNSEMNIWEHAFFSHENGTMHFDLWKGYDMAYRSFFCEAWAEQVWKKIEGNFSEQFKAHVNKISPEDCSDTKLSGN